MREREVAKGGPLSGFRVLDLTHVLNGPYCTMLLAHMGAEVIKIEYGSGDRFRHAWMPLDADHDGYEFLVVNANKQAITLNLKSDRGRELFLRLVEKADVVVENFTEGVMERLGIGYENLLDVNDRIIYACSRGYGSFGPYSQLRANAGTIMAVTGWTDASWQFARSEGFKAQGIGDEAAGVSMALGVVAALLAREQSGRGQKLEVSMEEALLGFMVGNFHTLMEGEGVGSAPKRCRDGYVAFHLPDMSDRIWGEFALGLGHPEAVDDPRFRTREVRRANHEHVEEAVSEWVLTMAREDLWNLFRLLGLSAAPVLTLAEAVEDPHLAERGAFVEVDDPGSGRRLKMLRPWIRFSGTPAEIVSPGPMVGEHNMHIYRNLLGLTADEIDCLSADGVI